MSKREIFRQAWRAVRDNRGSPWFALTLKGKRSNPDKWLASDYFPHWVSREAKVEAIGVALEVYHKNSDDLALRARHKEYCKNIVGVDPAELESV